MEVKKEEAVDDAPAAAATASSVEDTIALTVCVCVFSFKVILPMEV